VWPLRGIFGVLSRFPAGLANESGNKLTPAVVATWLTDSGTVACSCQGRVRHVARHGMPPADGTSQHARRFRGAIDCVSSRLGVSLSIFPRVVPVLFGDESTDWVGASVGAATDKGFKLDWDAEGIIEAFRTGHTVVSVVLSGAGSCRVPAETRSAAT